MRLVVSGGGTGGHVYPALEVAKLAQTEGHDVVYVGSLKGLEGAACKAAGVPFAAFWAEPIPRLASAHGVKTALRTLLSAKRAKRFLRKWGPDVLFSTGGYSAGPVGAAARAMGLPIVLLEQNSIPGRTNRMMGAAASKVCIVFDETAKFFPNRSVLTGMPVRQSLSQAADAGTSHSGFFTLCYGGSQGAAVLNEAVLNMAMRVGGKDLEWLQITGPSLFEGAAKAKERVCHPEQFTVKAFLTAEEMSEAYQSADLAIVRAGCGTIAELALFGIPAIFVPLPHAHADHQYHNAVAIEELGGGTVIRQSDLTPERLEAAWRAWHDNPAGRKAAHQALKRWAKPSATHDVLEVIKDAAAERS
jgi:UDP-N-acetylglucosamine--N-acetylmuramyl-(pentapeptide) pyrophosphoryl-undecaprenol N-acetylglucosamine transferase